METGKLDRKREESRSGKNREKMEGEGELDYNWRDIEIEPEMGKRLTDNLSVIKWTLQMDKYSGN